MPAHKAQQIRLKTNSEASLLTEQHHVLRDDIITAWEQFNSAVESNNKDYLRRVHLAQKFNARNEVSRLTLLKSYSKYKHLFRPGKFINPENIDPVIIQVTKKGKWSDIFKLCRAFWSMPYSKGYGRRLRFVIYDQYHDSVIGIIGLQSPPADLRCRDEWLNLRKESKLEVINCMLDAYTIGAVPPYNSLLGGKLVASIVSSVNISQAYWKSYAGKRAVISGKILSQPLLGVTTTSAFGRSSIYNRLRFRETLLAERLGYTKGYGTIHLEEIYPRIEQYLKDIGCYTPGGYGNGPKVRWQNVTRALISLGMNAKYCNHGLKREVFFFSHVENILDVCQKGAIPIQKNHNLSDLTSYWKERWAIPRAAWDNKWKTTVPNISLSKIINSWPD